MSRIFTTKGVVRPGLIRLRLAKLKEHAVSVGNSQTNWCHADIEYRLQVYSMLKESREEILTVLKGSTVYAGYPFTTDAGMPRLILVVPFDVQRFSSIDNIVEHLNAMSKNQWHLTNEKTARIDHSDVEFVFFPAFDINAERHILELICRTTNGTICGVIAILLK